MVIVTISDFAIFHFIDFVPFVPLLNCEKFIRQNPVVAELQPLKLLLPGGKISEIDFFLFLNSSIFSCKHWHIGVIGSCEYMASLLTNRMNLDMLVFAQLKTIAGNYNFVPAEQTLGSNILSFKYQHTLFLSEIISRPVVY